MSEDRLFPYALPCIMIACYCVADEEVEVWFNPRCLYDDPSPSVDCD